MLHCERISDHVNAWLRIANSEVAALSSCRECLRRITCSILSVDLCCRLCARSISAAFFHSSICAWQSAMAASACALPRAKSISNCGASLLYANWAAVDVTPPPGIFFLVASARMDWSACLCASIHAQDMVLKYEPQNDGGGSGVEWMAGTTHTLWCRQQLRLACCGVLRSLDSSRHIQSLAAIQPPTPVAFFQP